MNIKRVHVFTLSPGSAPPSPGVNAANLVYDISKNKLVAITRKDRGDSSIDVTSGSPDKSPNKINAKIITSNYNITSTDYVILVDASQGNIDIYLPDSSNHEEMTLIIKKIDSSTRQVRIIPYLNQTIDGETIQTITTPKVSITLLSKNNWHIL